MDSNSGVFTWRPTIAQASSTQAVTVVVSDNGSPALTATQSFLVTVISPASPALNPAFTNSQFGFWINGDAGPDYTIQSSTNLVSWNPVFTTNSPAMPFFWGETMHTRFSSTVFCWGREGLFANFAMKRMKEKWW
ncbi:MAG: hypothetical protein WDN00_01770 [Limisphaerales bacterium]